MEIDWNLVRARFSGMTREKLLEETALRSDEYAPLVRQLLAGEALARGITAEQIEARRTADTPTTEPDGIDMPALITSSDEKSHVQELVQLLRERDIPAVIRELDPKHFHASGHRVGRWGLMVSGSQAAAAVRTLEATIPQPDEESLGASCGGGCGSCGPGAGACDSSEEEWPEDGDWWKTVPGEEDPHP